MDGTTETGTATPTLSSTPETAPAAPATSAPVSTPTPSERPRTIQEAFARDAATQDPAATETPAPVATEPAAQTTPDGVPPGKPPGPIPFDAHKTALENARTKATQDAEAKFAQDYGWAKQITPEQLQTWTATARAMAENPIQFLQEFSAQLRDHPVYGPKLRSEAARMLATQRSAQPPEPDVAITDEAGRVVGRTYSDAALQKRDEWLIQRVLGQVQGELSPLKQSYEAQQAEHAAAVQRQAIESEADAVIADVRAIVGDDQTALKAVSEAMDAHPEWTAHRAAAHVFQTVLSPKFKESAKAGVLDDLKTRAAASTVNPSMAAVPSQKRPTSLLDPALQW